MAVGQDAFLEVSPPEAPEGKPSKSEGKSEGGGGGGQAIVTKLISWLDGASDQEAMPVLQTLSEWLRRRFGQPDAGAQGSSSPSSRPPAPPPTAQPTGEIPSRGGKPMRPMG